MKPKLLVKLSNIIGIVSIALLIYWVFIFIISTVFGFKVFRENITEIFGMSIMGILALMAGALMINIMFNLTRIADKQDTDDTAEIKKGKRLGFLILLTFPLIFGLLAGGDYLTSRKKEQMLIASAESIIADNKEKVEKLADYGYNLEWLKEAEKTISILSQTDKNFPNVGIIVKDTIDSNTDVYLKYGSGIWIEGDSIRSSKTNYMLRTTKEERDYLEDVFKGGSDKTRFSSHDGDYELFYPYRKDGKIIVFHFSEYQRYGKLGS